MLAVDRRTLLGWILRILVIGAASSLPIIANTIALPTLQAGLLATALKEVTPEGYEVEKTIACGADRSGRRLLLVALADAVKDQLPERPVMLLLVTLGKKVVVQDRVIPRETSTSGIPWDSPPNYLDSVSRESLGGADLFLVKTVLSGGGSGSVHLFEFYKPEQNKLHLVKSFLHGRMEQTYFAVHKNAIYDAEKTCTRGEKRGKAYVYTCYLTVTKYEFDGQAINPVGSERMRAEGESIPDG